MKNEIKSFEWDNGNVPKLLKRFTIHEIVIFFEQELFVFHDEAHSETEERLIAVGNGPNGKGMFVCYTLRKGKIRVISARYMRRKELEKYEIFKESQKIKG